MLATDSVTTLVKPLQEGGFVALSAILLVVLIVGGAWVIRKLLEVIGRNNEVIAGCAEAMRENTAIGSKNLEVQQEILRKMQAIDTRCEERCRG